MKESGVDAYLILSSDSHMSEYVAARWKGREWISGFTGSAGTVVITHSENGLWTDGRYHIQAEKQLQGSGITLFKQGLPNVPYFPEWLADTLPENSVVGLYGEVFSRSQLKNLQEKLEVKNISINTEYDLLNDM